MTFDRSLIVLLVMFTLGSGSAQAQSIGTITIPGAPSDIGSPAVGSAPIGTSTTSGTVQITGSSPVGPVGVPLGSTELGIQGLSPGSSTTSTSGSIQGSGSTCLGAVSAAGESPPPAALFDGG